MTARDSTKNVFYTYAHYRATAPERGPFYIGKGKGPRAWKTSGTGRNLYWQRIVKKYGLLIEIIAVWPTEQEALDHEVFLIECFRHLETGLVNMTDGGEGLTNPSPEVAHKIRARALEQWSDPAQRAAMIAARSTVEALAKKSASLKRAFSAPGSSERRSASLKAAKNTPESRERRRLVAQSPAYRAKMSEILTAARARPEVKAKHDAANAAKKSATAARKANEPKPIVMSKRECGLVAGATNRAKADARRALLPPEERARLEKQAADRLRYKNLQREARKRQLDADLVLAAQEYPQQPAVAHHPPETTRQ